MPDTVIVLTGASRGLGAALARALLASDTLLITLARRPDPALQALAGERGCQLEQIAADLSDATGLDEVCARVRERLAVPAQRYRLINNAGTVQPVGRADALHDATAVAAALTLNVTAAVALTAAFLQASAGPGRDRRVLNISSGAGRNPNPGWAVYCATKAALDMYTRVAAAEQPEGGARLASLAPGVVDTDMQAEIRATDPAHFPALQRFQAMHREGKLASPEAVAARIVAYLERDDFGATCIDDIRNY
jgi:Short-chain dehydrogenases of various substrate specificities